jgi:arylsulfatase
MRQSSCFPGPNTLPATAVRLAACALAAAIAACGSAPRAPGRAAGPSAPIAPAAARAPRQPNVVLVVADDLSAGEVGCYGQRRIRTPRIDALAAEGVRLTDFDAAAPVCAPSRAAMLTGLHTGHCPIRDNREVGEEGQAPLGADAPTLVHDLRRRGFATGLFGKWGLGGPGSGSEPLDCGFDAFVGFMCQRKAHDHYPASIWDGRARVALEGNPPGSHGGASYAHDAIRDAATRFIRTNAARPFLLVYASTLPHAALQVPEAELSAYAGAFPETPYDGSKGYLPHPTPRAAYAAMVTRLDADVGALVDAVRAAGIERDTIVIVTADNGATHDVGGVDTAFFESTAGLRGRKGSLHEGGLRVPFVAWAPGRIAPGRVLDEPAWAVDLRATVDAWCAAGAPASDGRDLSRWLAGTARAPARPLAAYWEFPGYGGQQAVAWQDGARRWKAVRSGIVARGDGARLELFDLASDPSERQDIAGAHPDVAREAARRMQEGHAPCGAFPMPVPRGADIPGPR